MGRRPSSSAKCTILVVEDNATTQQVVCKLIRSRGFEVVAARSCEEARQMAASVVIHFLISDIGLPDGSGYDLMTEMRTTLGIEGVAVSGYGMEMDAARSKESGFLKHYTKPIHIDALEEILRTASTIHEQRTGK